MNKRALISVYDKSGIVDFAKELVGLGWEIISTGGTYELLKSEIDGIKEVGDITGFKEILGGRVKTLHPNIHGGILHRRDRKEDIETLKDMDIGSIDMVVNNLYPFEEVLKKEGVSHDELIDNIDIGGPSMIRAAAKNHKDVIIVIDPRDYSGVVSKLKSDGIDENYRRILAAKAFGETAYYDGLISSYFNELLEIDYPEKLGLPFKKDSELRYGENPIQRASFYRDGYQNEGEEFKFEQLHGKELSFNNLNDLYGAIRNLKEFDKPTVVAVKHTNPCGIGSDDNLDRAFDKAYECDDTSIFGGIIAINREVNEYVAERLNSIFIEIVVAEGFTDEALKILQQKKNIRIISCPNINEAKLSKLDKKDVLNGMLLQDRDTKLYDEDKLKIMTKREPSEEEMADLIFGLKASKNINSNGVVLVRDEATVGLGFGEVRRSWAVENALERAEGKLDGAVLVSDGFFFEDTIELLHEYGIKAVMSPGGSVKDENVIELCDKYDISLVFTGMRHFKH